MKLLDTSKPLFEIWSGDSDNPQRTIDLSKIRDKIHVRLNMVTKTYDVDSVEKVDNKYFPLTRCSEQYLNNTDYEKQFYNYNKEKFLYCVEDPGVYMQGTRDS